LDKQAKDFEKEPIIDRSTAIPAPRESASVQRRGQAASEQAVPLPVSVIVPAYNRAHMLERCLTSIWSQRPRIPAEVLVIDDGSADDTAEVAERLGASVVRHPHNRGLSAARNSGLRAASHEWVALLDSDDEWQPHHLGHLWPLRESHVLVAGSALMCGADPLKDHFHGPVSSKPVVLRSGDRLICPGNMIAPSGALVQRDLALRVGGFQSYRGGVEDLDMWLRLLQHGTAICSPRVSVIYHVHSDQLSLQDQSSKRLATGEATRAHMQRTGGSRASIRRWEGIEAWDSLRAALRASDSRGAVRWGRRMIAHPHSLEGVASVLLWRFRLRRRSVSLRAIGVGPAGREKSLAPGRRR
jgi:GT2 family glycosyltransferase